MKHTVTLLVIKYTSLQSGKKFLKTPHFYFYLRNILISKQSGYREYLVSDIPLDFFWSMQSFSVYYLIFTTTLRGRSESIFVLVVYEAELCKVSMEGRWRSLGINLTVLWVLPLPMSCTLHMMPWHVPWALRGIW